MDITSVIVSIITAISAIIVSVIGAINIRSRKQAEHMASLRSQEFRLGMDMQAASIELSDVIAIAVTGGHTNGNVEAARQKAQEAKSKYYAFIKTIAADTLATR